VEAAAVVKVIQPLQLILVVQELQTKAMQVEQVEH
jgi:hypothetical protein